uniref:Putative secreted protein n=1 Tax=Ixodes ricinus TaxID=34613 RepID=V5ID77_IXORI
MLPICKMQLVVFAVVLILPALLSGGFLSATETHYDCMDLLGDCGDLSCLLAGSGDLDTYDPDSCTFVCSGSERPKVPRTVCTGDFRTCPSSLSEALRNLKDKLESAVNGVLKAKCPSFPKK